MYPKLYIRVCVYICFTLGGAVKTPFSIKEKMVVTQLINNITWTEN